MPPVGVNVKYSPALIPPAKVVVVLPSKPLANVLVSGVGEHIPLQTALWLYAVLFRLPAGMMPGSIKIFPLTSIAVTLKALFDADDATRLSTNEFNVEGAVSVVQESLPGTL